MDDRLVLDPAAARDFAIALFVGALIGIGREKRKPEGSGREVGGIRTFVLFSQIGALAAWCSRELASPWPLAAALFGVAIVLGAAAAARLRRDAAEPPSDLTTEAAAVVTTLLGATALLGFPDVAGALGILTAALLAFKQPIHGWIGRLDVAELYAALKLLIASFIVLPLLPDRAVDPFGALNPYEIWLLVVLISALSFVGWVAVRWLGHGRGAALTGLFGGLASSTAVTLSFARRSRELGHPSGTDALAAGMLLAWAIMFARILAEVAFVHPVLVPRVAVPQLAMLVVAGALAAGFYARSRGAREVPSEVLLRNPFRLTPAVEFAAFFAIVLLAVGIARAYAPSEAQYAVAALAGVTDVDAITLSMATLARDGGDASTAARAIAVAAFANTLTKTGVVLFLGDAGLRRRIAPAAVAIVAAGAVAAVLA